jgi:tetratricopeptide (TPR) repeat protein
MAFGILWVVLTLFPVSNLLLPTGILLAERTLFLPSVGAMLAVGATAGGLLPALQSLAPARRTLVLAGLWTVVVVGLLRSALRQPVWRDNQTLFAQTVRDAPTSYKAVAAHAVMLLETGQDTAGLREYRTALSIYPDDPNLFLDLGNWYLGKGRCEDALESYARVLELAPGHWAATSRSVLCLIHLDRLDQARAMAQTAVSRGDEGAREKLAYVDSLIARRGARTGP